MSTETNDNINMAKLGNSGGAMGTQKWGWGGKRDGMGSSQGKLTGGGFTSENFWRIMRVEWGRESREEERKDILGRGRGPSR